MKPKRRFIVVGSDLLVQGAWRVREQISMLDAISDLIITDTLIRDDSGECRIRLEEGQIILVERADELFDQW